MKKVEITQELCRKAQMMLAGGKAREVARLLGVSETTVSRIKAAGFDPVKYAENTDRRRIIEKNTKADKAIEEIREQVAGQICMDLQSAEEQKPEMSEQVKMMRFLAGKFNEVDTTVQVTQAEILLHIGKIEDYMAQILRKMDG